MLRSLVLRRAASPDAVQIVDLGVRPATFTVVEGVDGGKIFGGKLEAEDVDVLCNALGPA